MKSAAIPASVLLLAGAGCSIDTQSSVVIDGFYSLVFAADSNTCVHAAEDTPVSQGGYDAGLGQLGTSYYQYILVRNNLPDNSDDSAGRLNSNDLQVRAVDVTIDNVGPWKFLPASQTVPVSASVKSGGFAFLPIGLVSPTLAGAMVQGKPDAPSPVGAEGDAYPLMLRVRARGVLLDGSEVETNEMQFPITVYNKRSTQSPCATGETLSGCSIVDTANGAFPVQADGWTCVAPAK